MEKPGKLPLRGDCVLASIENPTPYYPSDYNHYFLFTTTRAFSPAHIRQAQVRKSDFTPYRNTFPAHIIGQENSHGYQLSRSAGSGSQLTIEAPQAVGVRWKQKMNR